MAKVCHRGVKILPPRKRRAVLSYPFGDKIFKQHGAAMPMLPFSNTKKIVWQSTKKLVSAAVRKKAFPNLVLMQVARTDSTGFVASAAA